jgi:hypothetical protein
MIHKTFRFDLKELNLNVLQIERAMGYSKGESHETVSVLIAEVLKESENICSIKAEFGIFDAIHFNTSGKTAEINDLVFNIKKIIFNQIRQSDSIAVFLCTAGKETGLRSSKAMKDGDLLKGYVYDVVGSEIVEAAADMMQNELDKELLYDGKRSTNRFSPGYCGWDVAEQHKLFQLLPVNFCGISLTASALMDPVKSVSGFIGIGRDVRRLPYTCNFCDRKDCTFRRVKA